MEQEATVGTVGEESHSSTDNCCVGVVQSQFGEEFVTDPERNRSGETEEEAQRHPLVFSSYGIEMLCESTPCDCLGVG